jgi:hypothetical protein
MKYFIDTEFKEKPCTIDLISIGIVCEDGREYYAVRSDFNLKEAWSDDWLNENVLRPIFNEFYIDAFNCNMPTFNFQAMEYLIKKIGKPDLVITTEIIEFVNPKILQLKQELTGRMFDNAIGDREIEWNKFIIDHRVHLDKYPSTSNIYYQPEFYAYYSAYDWVAFCWIFGRMLDLPKGFPMYCKDLKQMMDDKGLTKEWKRINCPDPIGEHNALIDAKWNLDLYRKLIEIK